MERRPPRPKYYVRGGPTASRSTSLSTSDAVNAFNRSRRAGGISVATLGKYHRVFTPFIQRFQILPQSPQAIDDFLASITGTLENRWTYRQTLVALYHFLEKRYRIRNPMPAAARVKLLPKVRRVLSEEELGRLFTNTKDFQEKVMLTLLVDAKLRAGECRSLVREQVFPDHVIVQGKTGQRQVPIQPVTYDLLVQLAPSGPLFTVGGRPLRREYLTRAIRLLMERSGLSGVKLGPHILRHSAAVLHLVGGGDLMSLQQELGHTTPKMTAVYARLGDDQVRQKHVQVNVVGKLLKIAEGSGGGSAALGELAKLHQEEGGAQDSRGKPPANPDQLAMFPEPEVS